MSDETWVHTYRYDPETKIQPSQSKVKNSHHPKECHQVWLNIKAILIVFFGLIYDEFVPTRSNNFSINKF